MWMFKKIGRVDVKLLQVRDQDDVLETAFGNGMEDFDIHNSDEEGQNMMKVHCATQRSIFCNLNMYFFAAVLSTRTPGTIGRSRLNSPICRITRTQNHIYTGEHCQFAGRECARTTEQTARQIMGRRRYSEYLDNCRQEVTYISLPAERDGSCFLSLSLIHFSDTHFLAPIPPKLTTPFCAASVT